MTVGRPAASISDMTEVKRTTPASDDAKAKFKAALDAKMRKRARHQVAGTEKAARVPLKAQKPQAPLSACSAAKLAAKEISERLGDLRRSGSSLMDHCVHYTTALPRTSAKMHTNFTIPEAGETG